VLVLGRETGESGRPVETELGVLAARAIWVTPDD
jgi:hypothetical protein